jgi:hypothetical protein
MRSILFLKAGKEATHCPNGKKNDPQCNWDFCRGLTPIILRRINEQLLRRLLEGWPKDQWGIGLIDATDLPAATSDRAAVPGLLSSR